MPHECGPVGGPKGGFKMANWCWKLSGKQREALVEGKRKADEARLVEVANKAKTADRLEALYAETQKAEKQQANFRRTKLYSDISETLDTDDESVISEFHSAMKDAHGVLKTEAQEYNAAVDELIDQFHGADVSGRQNRGAVISKISRAEDPTKVEGFDQLVQYVRDNPSIAAQLASKSDNLNQSTEALVFAALKQGKKPVPSLNSDEVWDAVGHMLEGFGPLEQYEKKEEELVPFGLELSMSKFWKEVIRPGKYRHNSKGGLRQATEITSDRIEHWHNETQRMLKSGLNIPAPYYHTDEAKPAKVKDDVRDLVAYVTDSEVQSDGSLWMLFDPVNEEAAAKINNEVRHVSIRTDNFEDGQGNSYKDAITHVAACHNGVMQDQKPFVPEHGLALSLTFCDEGRMADSPTETPSLEMAISLLGELGIKLGADTTPENFIERLCTAAMAVSNYKNTEEGEDEWDQKPEGAKTQKPAPIAMSSLLQFSISTMQDTPKNPATDAVWTEQELEAAYEEHKSKKPKLEFSAEQQAAFDNLQRANKQMIVEQFRSCVASGTITEDAANGWIDVLNDVSLQFSADGTVDESPLTYKGMFDALRLAKANGKGAAHHGTKNIKQESKLKFSLHEPPKSFENEQSDADLEKVADGILAMIG